MSVNLARSTLYLLISSFETDLRNLLDLYVASKGTAQELVPSSDAYKRAAERAKSEGASDAETLSLTSLLNYLEFGDLLQVVRRHLDAFPGEIQIQLRQFHDQLDGLASTRNRVMHGRPLEYDDLPKTVDITDRLLAAKKYWPEVSNAVGMLKAKPDVALGVNIPIIPEQSRVSHNLPIPEFDETGFIGRQESLRRLISSICGVYPVITVVGEGGLGKTSLALKAAYDILDDVKCPFDAIIFVSAKTSQLTVSEIRRIEGAVHDSIGLISSAVEAISGGTSDPLGDLVELLRDFKILLILDNLETVVDENIHRLAGSMPEGSKLLITSRIGLGAFEFPIKLEGLSGQEATQLLRVTATISGVQRLVAMPDSKLRRYTDKMRNNPLHIKWFVATVRAGRRPEEILSDERLFLQFCLSNVYDQLSAHARVVVRALLAVGGANTTSEIAYLSNLNETDVISAIQELLKTNMFIASSSTVGASFRTKYELSNLSRAYLTRFYPIRNAEQQEIVKAKRQLVAHGEQLIAESRANPLSPYLIHCRDKGDAVPAKHLSDCLKSMRVGDYESAHRFLERAKLLAPEFYEVSRVEGWLLARTGSLSDAAEAYERAIELAPEAAHVRMFYGGFLLLSAHDTEAALPQYEKAVALLPEQPELKLELARCNLYLKEFDRASSLLSSVSGNGGLSERLRRKTQDLQIQIFVRQAEGYVQGLEFIEGLKVLEELRIYANDVDYLDPRMRKRLADTTHLVGSIKHGVDDPEVQERANEYYEWLCGIFGAGLSGRVASNGQEEDVQFVRLASGGRFGFARTNDDRSVFIHHSQCNGFTLSSCLPGDLLRLTVVTDEQGRLRGEDVVRR